MDVDLAEQLTLTIGTGEVPVEIETEIVMDPGELDTGTVTAMEHGTAVAKLTAMEHGAAVAKLTAMEHGIAVAKLTAMEGGVAVTDNEARHCLRARLH